MILAFSTAATLSSETILAIRASALRALRKGDRRVDLAGIELVNGNDLCKAPRAEDLGKLAAETWLRIYDRELARRTPRRTRPA
jgi:hypothetical protein